MSECCYKLVKDFSVWRQGMGDRPSLVFFVNQTRLSKLLGVFGDCFDVAVQTIGDIFKTQALMFCDQSYDFNPSVIRDSF